MRRPVLLFDGDCGFCRVWIERWRASTGDAVEYRPYQEAGARLSKAPPEALAEAVRLVEPGGRECAGAEAAFRALAHGPGPRWPLFLYERLPGFAPAAGLAYRFVARRRVLFSRLTRALWGATPAPPPLERTARWTLAGIGACYLAAFLSLAPQLRGLIGADGILPAAGFLASARAQLGLSRYWLVPSLAWLGASDRALLAMAWAGAAASLGLVLDVWAGPCALACWALYLSLCSVGGDFMGFQWDALLLEAGLVACFLAPWRRGAGRPRAALWLLRLLLFKLMLESGAVKLLSGDPAWRGLTALSWHYWTQPLPTPLAWWAARLPPAAQKASCAAMLAIELGAPILLLAPRRARFAGAAAIALLMAAVAATGNYGFFNLLTLVLCFACLDDRALGAEKARAPARARTPRALAAFAAVWLAAGALEGLLTAGVRPPAPARVFLAALRPLRSFNGYGLFAVMTKTRDEIALEVSADGREWKEWPFLWKPGDPRRAPPVVAPHMPRLDWQMWFAALGSAEDSPWFGNLAYRLLEGKPAVLSLLGPSPLGGETPRYLRAVRLPTTFASPEQRRADGSWWSRTRGGLYLPVVSLRP